MKLTSKQEMFCLEYLIDLNATQAAIRAGYSAKTAQQTGSENLAKPVIAERIRTLFGDRAAKVEVNAEWVLIKAKESFEINSKTFKNEDAADEMVNAAAAGKFLELCGKHVNVKAFDKEEKQVTITNNIMPVPTADSIDDWENQAQKQQDKILNK